MNKRARLMIFAGMMILVSACSAPHYIVFCNHTDADLSIFVESKIYQIKKGSSVTVNHPRTQIIKITLGNRTLKYKVGHPPGKYNRPFWPGSAEYEISCQIEPDELIYVINPDAAMPAQVLPPQPAGFPLVPVELGPR